MAQILASELAKLFRNDVGDPITDVDGGDFGCLWKNEEVYFYMALAVEAVAARTGTIYRVVRIEFDEGDETVECPPWVLDIRQARLVEVNQPVQQYNANDLGLGFREDYGAFLPRASMFGQSGRPTAFVRDYDAGRLRFVPTPNQDGTLEIQCTAKPEHPVDPDELLEFADLCDQELVLMKMKARAYRKHDAETEDLVRAKEWDAQFEHYARERESQLRRNRRAPGVVRMEW